MCHTYLGFEEFRNPKSSGITKVFFGELRGTIVSPRGDLDFGWGPIFVPKGSEKTFGEMTREEKLKVSMRRRALDQLRDFLGAPA